MPQVKHSLELRTRSRRHSGFSLVELVVVLMIIVLIVAIAIPSMTRARMKANEASALASVKTIQAAEVMYSNAYPMVGFAGSLADLGAHGTDCQTTSKTNSCLITDSALTSGLKSGYTFEVVGDGSTPTRGYTITAAPESVNASGRCTFTSDQSGQIQITGPGTSTRFTVGGGGGCGS
jgi:prepilin-type N-terminal cleavage/methylation domain-containing protein